MLLDILCNLCWCYDVCQSSNLITGVAVGAIGAAVTGNAGQPLREAPVAVPALIAQITQHILIGTSAGAKDRAAVTYCAIGVTLAGCMGHIKVSTDTSTQALEP